jgi:hypothetical protein
MIKKWHQLAFSTVPQNSLYMYLPRYLDVSATICKQKHNKQSPVHRSEANA